MEYIVIGWLILLVAFLVSIVINIYLLDQLNFKNKMNEALIGENAVLRENRYGSRKYGAKKR